MLPSCNSDNSLFDFLFDRRPSNNNFITYDPNPNSKQDDQGPPFFSNFFLPIFDGHELPLNQILSQNQPTSESPCSAIPSAIDQIITGQSKSMEIVEPSKLRLDHKKEGSNLNPSSNGSNVRRKNLGAVPRRTKGKKDRHSKICTAQGIRDRRMRLSLQAARKFFDLQDLLGYDKASKTIEWLFNNSKKAINELAKDHPQAAALRLSISTDAKSESLLSECEVVSGIGLNPKNEVKDLVSASAGLAPDCSMMTIQEEREKSQKSVVSKPNQRKESREKARVRARCRTQKKKMITSTDEHSDHRVIISHPSEEFKFSNPNESYLEPRIGSSSNGLFESDHHQETMITHLQERDFPQYYAVFGSFERDVGTIENLLGNTSSLSSAYFSISDHFNCSGAAVSGYSSDLNNAFMGFLGNWDDMINNDQKMNNFQYGVSLEDNSNSICSVTSDFL